jgi:hypothetical protein
VHPEAQQDVCIFFNNSKKVIFGNAIKAKIGGPPRQFFLKALTPPCGFWLKHQVTPPGFSTRVHEWLEGLAF